MKKYHFLSAYALYYQNDLFADEGVWLWKNGIPMLSVLRAFSVGTLLGPKKERQIEWYLQDGKPEKLLSQLTPQLDKVAQVILHCAVSVCDFASITFNICLFFNLYPERTFLVNGG